VSDHVEKFAATGGRLLGVIAVLLGLLVVVVWLVDRDSVAPWFAALAVFWVVASWAAFLRPQVAVHGRHLVLRGMLDTVRIPLRLVDSVAVRQVTAVGVGEKRYVSPAIGRTRRDLARQDGAPGRSRGSSQGTLVFGGIWRMAAEERSRQHNVGAQAGSYGLFVQERVLTLSKDARRSPLADGAPEERVERTYAWPEIVALAVTGVAVLVLVFV
jgi:hypothetical protein